MILKEIKRKRSPGQGDIHTCMIVDGTDEIATPLSVLINRCLETSNIPSEKKIAKITAIYKSGERSSMENYRPVSVLPVLSKFIERIVHQQLYSYLEKKYTAFKTTICFQKWVVYPALSDTLFRHNQKKYE